MSPNVPSNLLAGAILSDQDIRRAIKNGELSIKISRDLNGIDYYDAIRGEVEEPENCVESAGYRLVPGRYWDGKHTDFQPLPSTGYLLLPGCHLILESLQCLVLGDRVCALHFGLHHNQIAGVAVGSGQIQPLWGVGPDNVSEPTPIYISVSNSGNSNFFISPKEPISRLVFVRLTSNTVTERRTRKGKVLEDLRNQRALQEREQRRQRQQQEEQETRARNRNLLLLAGVSVLVVILFFVVPWIFAPLRSILDSNYYAAIVVAIFSFILYQVWEIVKGRPSNSSKKEIP